MTRGIYRTSTDSIHLHSRKKRFWLGIGTEVGTEVDLNLKAGPFQNNGVVELQLLAYNEATFFSVIDI
jgi:hypothetical protein